MGIQGAGLGRRMIAVAIAAVLVTGSGAFRPGHAEELASADGDLR
jgi:hypothetical protein